MRPVVAFLLMFFLSSSFVPAAFGQDPQNKHMNHFHSIDEFRSFVRKHSVSRLTDYVLREVSYFKLFDDVELNLYRRDHEPTMECISSSRLQFAQRVAKLLKQEKLTSKDSFKQLYDNWILQLKKEIESIPFSKDDIQSNANEFYETREINGPCVNMDFEEGTFNGWELRAGKQPGNTPYGVNNINPIAPGTQHAIMNGGNDPVVGIPRVNPDGGQYSARLGNGNSSNSDVAILRQVYQVDATNSLFTYSYAIVVEEPGHTLNEQPYFVIRMFDEAGNNIPCGSYSVQSTASNPDFISAPNSVLYQPWKTAFAPLEAYVGQNVTIEFRVADCSQGGHYGYAYVDASCSPFELVTPSGEPFICQGQPLEITAPSGANSYLWNTGETTQTITVSSGGYYEVQMIPITGAGCAIISGIQIDEAPNPVADFSLNPDQICANESVTFFDNSSVASGYIEFWQWDFGNGVTTQSANGQIINETNTSGTYDNPIHEYQQAGNPTITLTVTTNAGCTAQATNAITVFPAPTINAGPDLNLCPGDAFTPAAQGGVSYVWDNGLVDGQQANIGAVAMTYTVIGTDANGCTNTDSFTVNVDEIIVPDAGPDFSICIGQEAVLTATGAPDYQWNNGVVNGVSFIPNQTTTYTVSHTTPNGCIGSDEVTITVNPLPNIQAGNPVNVCAGQSVVLTGAGGVSYEWDNNVTNNIPFIPDLGAVTYTVTGTDANGCQNTSQVLVTVNDFPQPAFQVLNNEGCAPVIPTFMSSGHNANSSCLWDFGNGQVSQDCANISPIAYGQAGCYNVSLTITSEFGCSQTVTQNNAVCVWENPVANFSPSPDVVSSISPVSDMLNFSYNAVTYEWYFSDGGTSAQISPTHVFNNSGNNTIMLVAISPDGCVDTTYGSVFVNEELIVYVPNTFTPDNDDFNEVFKPVLHSGFDPFNYHLIIFNRWGEVMFESYDANFGWDGTYGGKLVQDGTYVWVLTVKRNNVDDREVFRGHVNIIR